MSKTILIVDDEDNLRRLIKDFLNKKGYETLEAENGEKALEIFKNRKDISLIILDVMMPELDGWDALEYIKKHFDVKVVMLTALTDEYDEVKGFRRGADDYVAKPFKRTVLIERVKRLLEVRAVEKSRRRLFPTQD